MGHVGQDYALIQVLLCPVASNDTLPDHGLKTLKDYTESRCFNGSKEQRSLAPNNEPVEVVYGVQDNREGCVLSYTTDERRSIAENIWAGTTLTFAGALCNYNKA